MQGLSISMDSLNLGTLSPMIIAIIGAIGILLTDLFNKNKDKSLYVFLVVLFLLFDLFTLLSFKGEERGVFDTMLIDGVSVLSQCIIICFAILFILLSLSKLKFKEYSYAEYFSLYLFVIASLQFMVSTDSLILILLGLETSSLAIYTMIAMHNRMSSIEASVKYFTTGALASSFFVFGSMIFYSITGSLELEQIGSIISQGDFFSSLNFSNYILLLVAFIFIFAALGFKLSLFPYHTWVPDVYQGSTSAMAGFLSVVPKMAAFVVALRFFDIFVQSNDFIINTMLYVTVVLTITIPNLIALQQTDVKRMLAYSSVSNAGITMSTIIIGTVEAIETLFLYWILFAITNFGAFGMLWLQRGVKENLDAYQLKKYKGLSQISPISSLILAMFLFSLAGLPPFSLFWAKMHLLSSAVNAQHLVLAIIIVINAVIASYYYIRPIVYMFLYDIDEETNIKVLKNSTTFIKAIIGFAVFLTLISVFLIEPIMEVITYYISLWKN